MVSAKTVETLIIVGGLAAIGGVVAYNVLKKQAQTPLPPSPPPPTTGCSSNSQCPSGYICVDGQCVQSKGCTSNSECPPNYVCQDGACVPAVQCGTQGAPCNSKSQCCSGYTCIDGICTSCPTGSCSCSEFWDPVSCSCQPLVPAVINVTKYQPVNLEWLINYNCNITGITKCITYCPSSPCVPCYNFTTGNSSASVMLELQGTVVDSGGKPICNQDVVVQYPSGVYTPPNNEYTVEFSVSGPGVVTTDSQGVFTIPVTYTATLTYMNYLNACIEAITSNYSTKNVYTQQLEITVQVKDDPSVQNLFVLTVYNTIVAQMNLVQL